MDQIMLGTSRQRNVCTLLIELDGPLDHDTLQQHLASDPAYRWITSLRLKIGRPFTLNQWRSDNSAALPEVKLIDNCGGFQTARDWVAPMIDPKKASPVRISLVQQLRKHSTLVLSWHHCLMDAHGSEIFIQYLGTLQKPVDPLWIQNRSDDNQQSPIAKLLLAHKTKNTLFDLCKPPLLSLYRHIPRRPNPAYRVLRFTEQETLSIGETAKYHGAGFILSSFYLAATAKSLATLLQRRNQAVGDILVPVPQDRRKRGAKGPVLRNQVTFLFYRIPIAELGDLTNTTIELVDQMKHLMRSNAPIDYLKMMDQFQRVPGFMYRFLMKSPTKGLMASFFYSDTGDSLNGFKTFLGNPVVNALHYPPNIFPPGLTFIYTRFRGKLQITLNCIQELITDDELHTLVENLKNNLLGCQPTQAKGSA